MWSNNTETRRAFATRGFPYLLSSLERGIETLGPRPLAYTHRLQRTSYVISRQQVARVVVVPLHQIIHRGIAYEYKIYDRDKIHPLRRSSMQSCATSRIGHNARDEDPRSLGIRTTMHWFCTPHAWSLSFLMYGYGKHCTH